MVTRSRIVSIVLDELAAGTSGLEEEEIQAVSEAIVDRLVDEVDDIYDDRQALGVETVELVED